MIIPDNKTELLSAAEEKVKFIQKNLWTGFMTEKEKYSQSIKVRGEVKKVIE